MPPAAGTSQVDEGSVERDKSCGCLINWQASETFTGDVIRDILYSMCALLLAQLCGTVIFVSMCSISLHSTSSQIVL